MRIFIDQICDYFGNRQLETVTIADAEKWYSWRANNSSSATLNRDVRRIKQFFEKAVDYGIISSDPCRTLKGGQSANRDLFEFAEDDRVQKILDQWQSQQWRTIFILARYLGLRVNSELCDLQWSHVDFEASRITIPKHKTRERVCPMFPEVKRELIKEGSREGYVIKACRVKGNLDAGLQPLISRASVRPWPKSGIT